MLPLRRLRSPELLGLLGAVVWTLAWGAWANILDQRSSLSDSVFPDANNPAGPH